VALSSNTIDENVAGAVIGKLATDEDAADTHTFKVDDTRFEVDALGNLKLKAGQSLNYEARNSVVVNVTATDNGSPALSKEQAFTITVNDRNDAPEAARRHRHRAWGGHHLTGPGCFGQRHGRGWRSSHDHQCYRGFGQHGSNRH